MFAQIKTGIGIWNLLFLKEKTTNPNGVGTLQLLKRDASDEAKLFHQGIAFSVL